MAKIHSMKKLRLDSFRLSLLPRTLQNFASHFVTVNVRIAAMDDMLSGHMELDEIDANVLRFLSPLKREHGCEHEQHKTQQSPHCLCHESRFQIDVSSRCEFIGTTMLTEASPATQCGRHSVAGIIPTG